MSKLQVFRDATTLLDINILTNRERLLKRKFIIKGRKSLKRNSLELANEDKRSSKTKVGSKHKLKAYNESDDGEEEEEPQKAPGYQRVFLYLQPQAISYAKEGVQVEIELYHEKQTITCLSETYTDKNIINVFDFKLAKPTFSMTIDQDSPQDVTLFSDSPMLLTLYECYEVHASSSTLGTYSAGSEEASDRHHPQKPIIIERVPVAQGYIDLLQFFLKKRSCSSLDVILYPLLQNAINISCKMVWEIYSLMPLIKDMNFSNAIFLTFTSIYNADEELMDNCEDLVATLSFQSTVLDEEGKYPKYFICKYTSFIKQIIADQVCTYKWESLKNPDIQNTQSMTIRSDLKFNIVKVLQQLLPNENVNFGFDRIDLNNDYALICNSMHRYILTDKMHLTLEQLLHGDKMCLIVEIFRESEPEKVLLEGFIDLAIFLYPSVTTCNFAVELKPPQPLNFEKWGKRNSAPSTKTSKKLSPMRLSTTGNLEGTEAKTTFAIVKICAKVAITEPPQDLNQVYNVTTTKREIYKSCNITDPSKKGRTANEIECEEAYRCFDDSIYQLVDSIIHDKLRPNTDVDNFLYCSYASNVTNRILALLACDFNRRIETKTTIEFTNLLTLVYKELMVRAYRIVMKNEDPASVTRLTYKETQNVFIARLSLVKYMFILNNMRMVNYILGQLKDECVVNPLLNFYIFLFDVECGNMENAFKYLHTPSIEKETEGLLFIPLIEIYLNYVRDLMDPETESKADENLLASLTKHCEQRESKYPTCWVLLYCVYQKYNYRPGLEYCRRKFEQLQRYNIIDIRNLPIPLWEIYYKYELTFKTARGLLFWCITKYFLRQGLYYFAQLVFNNISDQCTEYERYMFESTLDILIGNITPNYKIRKFTFNKEPNAKYLYANISYVNGNIAFAQDPSSTEANIYYSEIIKYVDTEESSTFNMGILRYGASLLKQRLFAEAKEVFEFCKLDSLCAIVTDMGVAKSFYGMGDLKSAEKYFAKATQHKLYIPGIWFYLAIINFRLGENYKALECWRYARLDFNARISPEIMREIEELNIDEINLYVDIPEPEICDLPANSLNHSS